MVNVVPREVPRSKPSGPAAPRVLALGPPEAQHSPWYLLGFFQIMSQDTDPSETRKNKLHEFRIVKFLKDFPPNL